MAELKDRLRTDLTRAIKARDELTTATLRMVLTAISTEEVRGTAHELTDDDVLKVLGREAKKRREAADAFGSAGRAAQAEREVAEGQVLQRYLPTALSDAEVTDAVRAAIAEVGATELRQMGAVMKAVQTRVQGRADGRRLSDEVRRQLTG
jgi:uncharacterized protein YqeY